MSTRSAQLGARDRHGDRRLHPRAGHGLPDPRHLLCRGALDCRPEFRPPDRLDRRADQLHPLRRLDRRLRAVGRRRASCSSGRTGSGSWSCRHLRRRPVHRGQHPAAAARRLEHRRASGLADVRAASPSASLFGFVGVLLAVPVTAAIGVLVRFAIAALPAERLLLGAERRPPATTGCSETMPRLGAAPAGALPSARNTGGRVFSSARRTRPRWR